MSIPESWEEAFARIAERAPPRTYGIAFTPRSGSTWISDVVRQSRALGSPGEYFNINAAFPSICEAACTNFKDYYQWLRRVRLLNGVFGFEISWPWIERLQADGNLDLLRSADYWFLLRRRDYILQAVSLHVAASSGVFHLSSDGTSDAEEAVSDDGRSEDVAYNADSIAEAVLQLMHGECQLARLFRAWDIEPEPLWYEDLIEQGPQDFLYWFAERISVELSPEDCERIDAIQPSLRKSGGERNAEFASRFRRERPEFIAHWDEYRGRMGAAAYRAMLAEAAASTAPDPVADP